MRKIEPEFITGMGYIGASPGVLYHMGGAGEQTVVTGNPAMLEGVKGSRFTSLTLHGKSTQVSTTGANILKDNYLSLCKGRIDLFSANGLFTVNANYEKACEFNLYFSAGSIFPDGIKDEETYYFVFRPIGFTPKYSYQLSLKNEKSESFVTSFNGNVTSVSGADLKKNVRIQLYFFSVSVSEPVVSGSRFQMIFSKKPDCIYEPYTGGKPSPSPEYPQEIESAGQSGEIDVDVLGKNLCEEERRTQNNIYSKAVALKSGITYILSSNKGIANLYFADAQTNKDLIKVYDKKSLTYTPDKDVIAICMTYRTPQIEDGEELQLEIGSVATAYEPYKPAQTLIIPTSGGLPGIPVHSGGNYTDEKGQQWVADEIDLANGEMVQRIGKTVVDGEKVKFVASQTSIYWNLPRRTSPGIIDGFIHISMYFAYETFSGNNTYEFAWTTPGIMKPYFDTPEELNAFCVQKNSEGNPLTIYYRIETPIRTPLYPETIAAYKALRTYSPTTTVANDACAGMSVGYKRK